MFLEVNKMQLKLLTLLAWFFVCLSVMKWSVVLTFCFYSKRYFVVAFSYLITTSDILIIFLVYICVYFWQCRRVHDPYITEPHGQSFLTTCANSIWNVTDNGHHYAARNHCILLGPLCKQSVWHLDPRASLAYVLVYTAFWSTRGFFLFLLWFFVSKLPAIIIHEYATLIYKLSPNFHYSVLSKE